MRDGVLWLKKRILGRTGHKSTLIALGGAIFIYPISRREVDAFIRLALDQEPHRRGAHIW